MSSMPWKKVESTSRPGQYYFYNTETKVSTWEPPHPPTSSKKRKKKSKTKLASDEPTERVVNGVITEVANEVEEDMECERWAEDEEVAMDVDLSVEEEQQLLSVISHTRGSLQLSSSLMSLQPSSGTPAYTEMLYLVLDTNVLLSHLQFLAELKDYAIKGVGRPVLILPWIVMQELDALKTSGRGNVASRARAAITFLYNCFSAGHPRVRGQTMQEVQTELDNIAITNNDDRILHCCLLYQLKVKDHGGVVVLFSNDTQLCSKAMVNQVHALNRKTLLSELRVLCRSMHQAMPTSYTHTSEFSSRMTHQLEKERQRVLVDDLLCESEGIVRDALSAVVSVEMELAFDNLWTTVVTIKPPWTLTDLIHIMEKHWMAVFGLVMERCYREDSLKKLVNHVKSRPNMLPECSDVDSFMSSSRLLLKAFPKRPNYAKLLSHSLASLDVLSLKLQEMKNGVSLQLPPTSPQPFPSPPPTSPTPTPPQSHVTPSHTSESSVSLVTLTMTEIREMTQSIPDQAEQQLPWILNIILEVSRQCLSRVASSLALKDSVLLRREASLFLSRLSTILTSVTVSMQHLLHETVDMPSLRNFRASLDAFLITSLELSCPLSLEVVVQQVPLQLQLMVHAVNEYSSTLDTLRMLAQQYSIAL